MYSLLLYISFNKYNKFQISKNLQKIVDEKKEMIQKRLFEKLRILVDVPKQGYGNTNDGNTARVFFKNADVVADITGKIQFFLFVN